MERKKYIRQGNLNWCFCWIELANGVVSIRKCPMAPESKMALLNEVVVWNYKSAVC